MPFEIYLNYRHTFCVLGFVVLFFFVSHETIIYLQKFFKKPPSEGKDKIFHNVLALHNGRPNKSIYFSNVPKDTWIMCTLSRCKVIIPLCQYHVTVPSLFCKLNVRFKTSNSHMFGLMDGFSPNMVRQCVYDNYIVSSFRDKTVNQALLNKSSPCAYCTQLWP